MSISANDIRRFKETLTSQPDTAVSVESLLNGPLSICMQGRDVLLEQRQGLLQQVNALERALDLDLTTAEIRAWFKRFGPPTDEVKRRLAEK